MSFAQIQTPIRFYIYSIHNCLLSQSILRLKAQWNRNYSRKIFTKSFSRELVKKWCKKLLTCLNHIFFLINIYSNGQFWLDKRYQAINDHHLPRFCLEWFVNKQTHQTVMYSWVSLAMNGSLEKILTLRRRKISFQIFYGTF